MDNRLVFEHVVAVVGDDSSSFIIVVFFGSFAIVILVFAFHLCCLAVWWCHGKHKGYPRTNGQNAAIFGRTHDHMSSQSTTCLTKQAKRENNNNDDDGDDGVVHRLHAAVKEQQMSTYGVW